MNRHQPLIVVIAIYLVILLCGCSVSSHPPIPLQVVTTATLLSGTTNISYAANLSASGGVPPYNWSIASGNVPPGLALSSAGTLVGTPSSAGAFTFTAQVTDLAQPQEVANVVVSVNIIDQLLVTTAALPNGSPGVYYNVAVAATGGIAPYSWKVTQGSLPTGLSLNRASGVISGKATDTGSSIFTIQISDSQNPVATASASLSISVNMPPPRNAVLYLPGGSADHINVDGSLTLLPSVITPPAPLALSATLPILFTIDQTHAPGAVVSMLVNPDYSLTPITSATLPPGPPTIISSYGWPLVVDPTGSNLYVPGYLDEQGTQGLFIYPADGSLHLLDTVTIPNVLSNSPRLIAFTPDGKWGYISPCVSGVVTSSILTYSRSSDGKLTQTSGYAPTASNCPTSLTVSPDGKYLADVEFIWPLGDSVQVYSIASDGTIAPVVNQQFMVPVAVGSVADLIWDESSSYLLPMIVNGPTSPGWATGGAAVLSFSGSALTETNPPTGVGGQSIQRVGSFVYTSQSCSPPPPFCPSCWIGPDPCLSSPGPSNFNLKNGQLEPLPGSQGAGGSVVY